jgi:uncharacterized protein (DUF1800 family)
MTLTRTLVAIRFGYGLPLPDGAPDAPGAMLTALAGPDLAARDWPIDGLAVIQPKLAELRGMKGAGKTDPALKPRHDQLTQEVVAAVAHAERMTFARALTAADGFRERLVAFWADHFTVLSKTTVEGMMPFALVEDVIRPRLTGRFADLLTEATLHPAMLIYLDQIQSTGPNSFMGQRKDKGLNENLARELIELHSMGVGAGYSQDDVREMAELLTGVTYDARRGMWYERRRAEPGAETVLGQTYDGEGLEVIRRALGDLARRPETAAHIARKLAVHFVSDSPDPALVAALETAFLASDGDLTAVYTALLTHPAAWGGAAEKVRQPFDFMVSSLRAVGLTGARFLALKRGPFRQQVLRGMAGMGQVWKRPGGPDGWAEEAGAWISPQLLAARITWAMQAPERLLDALPDPVALAETCLADRASERLLWAAARAENRREGVGLVLASAEFNRR